MTSIIFGVAIAVGVLLVLIVLAILGLAQAKREQNTEWEETNGSTAHAQRGMDDALR